MERKAHFVENEFYHIYNRGVEKRIIFKNNTNYKRFLALLYLANSSKTIQFRNKFSQTSLNEIFEQDRGEPLVAIGAYCLMPNHFHLVLSPLTKDGITKFMLKLQTGYSMYFNIKYDRVGSLFQGTFKSRHLDNDRYLRYIFAYVHLNPAKLKNSNWKTEPATLKSVKKFIFEYPYSSLREYLTKEYKIINPAKFPVDLNEIKNYNAIVDDFSAEYQG